MIVPSLFTQKKPFSIGLQQAFTFFVYACCPCLLAGVFSFAPISSKAQKTEVRFFGHQEFAAMDLTSSRPFGDQSQFVIGEQDIFINSQLNDRISFLGETVIRPKSDGLFEASIERARLKYALHSQHSIIVGKMHTPVNYWNDVYHHGRLFFPTVNRPRFFTMVVPLHTMGIRFQGQNLGKLKFGYDVLLGNGISSTDILDMSHQKSLTLAAHIKPKRNMRLGLSYYRDLIEENRIGAHSGHGSNMPMMENRYQGDIAYDIFSLSFASFQAKNEILLELAYNLSSSDSLGQARNFLSYAYYGRRLFEREVIYGFVDYSKISDLDLHVMPQDRIKFGFGIRHEFSHLVVAKIEFNRSTNVSTPAMGMHTMHMLPNRNNLLIQLAYGF